MCQENISQSSADRCSFHSLPPLCLTTNGVALIQVQQYKYLGMTITHPIYPGNPMLLTCVTKLEGLLVYFTDVCMCMQAQYPVEALYTSSIWPHLEYSSAVWNPYLKGKTEALEKVQKYALKVCTNWWDASHHSHHYNEGEFKHLSAINLKLSMN